MRALLPLMLLTGCLEKLGPVDSDLPPVDTGPDSQEPGCTFYADVDGDGYGDPFASVEAACDAQPSGYLREGGDCDDTDPAVHPGAAEICNDGVDDDCDVGTDEDADGDGDGVGPCSGDCDDDDAAVFPGAEEICDGVDNDCDPGTDEETDGDLDGWSICDGDCNDDDELVSPQAVEVEDGEDDDCDGVVDDSAVRCNISVPESYDTITEAMAAASAGATICVAPGEYAERLSIIDQEIGIVGVGGPVLTVLDGGGGGPVVEISLIGRLTATLAGLRLRGGQAGGDGGGVRVATGTAHLLDMVIEDCSAASRGGGIAVHAGSLELSDSEVRGNSAGYGGGGIYVTDGGGLVVSRSTVADNEVTGGTGCIGGGLRADDAGDVAIGYSAFTGNSATRGGGIDIGDTSRLVLTSVSLRDNAATGNGGGLYAYQTPIDAQQLWVSGNTATDWGGGIYGHDADFAITNAVIAGNQATWGAGGMELFGGSLDMAHGLFVRNQTSGPGGGLVLIDYADAALVSTIFLENTAGEGGGALHLSDEHEDLTLVSCDLWGDLLFETEGVGVLSSAENLDVDPALLDLSAADPWDWDVHLAVGSALEDGGTTLDHDPDFGPADIGPFGGAGAGIWDLDGDGYPCWWHPGAYDREDDPYAGWDCDDRDPQVHPGAGCE